MIKPDHMSDMKCTAISEENGVRTIAEMVGKARWWLGGRVWRVEVDSWEVESAKFEVVGE